MTQERAAPRAPNDPAVETETGQPDPSARQAGERLPVTAPPTPATGGEAGETPAAPATAAGSTAADTERDRTRRDLRQAGVTAVSLVAAGVPLGALWAAVAPRPDPVAVLAGADSALTAQISADLGFMVITAVAGAVAGVLAWRFVREPGWLAPVALALGGGAGALVAGAVGAAVNSAVPGLAGLAEQAGADLPRLEELLGFGVRAKSVYFAFPLAALVFFLVPSYVAGNRSSRRAPATPAAARQDQETAAG